MIIKKLAALGAAIAMMASLTACSMPAVLYVPDAGGASAASSVTVDEAAA